MHFLAHLRVSPHWIAVPGKGCWPGGWPVSRESITLLATEGRSVYRTWFEPLIPRWIVLLTLILPKWIRVLRAIAVRLKDGGTSCGGKGGQCASFFSLFCVYAFERQCCFSFLILTLDSNACFSIGGISSGVVLDQRIQVIKTWGMSPEAGSGLTSCTKPNGFTDGIESRTWVTSHHSWIF